MLNETPDGFSKSWHSPVTVWACTANTPKSLKEAEAPGESAHSVTHKLQFLRNAFCQTFRVVLFIIHTFFRLISSPFTAVPQQGFEKKSQMKALHLKQSRFHFYYWQLTWKHAFRTWKRMLNADHVLCASMQTHIIGLSKMNLAIDPSKTVRGETEWNQHPLHCTQTTQTHSNCCLGTFLSQSNAKLDMHKYPQTPSARSTFPYADCRGKQPCYVLACLHFSVAARWDCCQEIKWQNVGITRRGKHWIKTTFGLGLLIPWLCLSGICH